MRISAEGLNLIKRHESLVLKAYKDPVGVWTIGYGHTTAAGSPVVTSGLQITEKEADSILAQDVRMFETAVKKLVKVPLTQMQFDALVSFSFNLGEGALARSTLLRKLNAGDFTGAADEFPRWVHGQGKVLPGLVTRRAEERALFLQSGKVVMPTEPMKETTVPPWVFIGLFILGAIAIALSGGF